MQQKGKMKFVYGRNKRLLGLVGVAVFVSVGAYFSLGAGFRFLEARFMYSFSSDEVFVGEVFAVYEDIEETSGLAYWIQTIQVRFLSGSLIGQETEVHSRGMVEDDDQRQKLAVGEKVIISKNNDFQGDDYYIVDRYRLPELFFILVVFIGGVLLFGGMRGVASLAGLVVTILVLMFYIVPRILQGEDPLVVSFIGAVVIAITSLYLAHGVSRRTSVAIFGTLITLLFAVSITVFFTNLAHLLGVATEESFYLQLNVGQLSLHGLLLAGIIIGTLGVLDDVTIGQVIAVQEISRANQNLGFRELYTRATRIGREHIASLVNTLVLAYAGASFPLFLLIVVQSEAVPLWLAVNGEPIAEEILRTIVGSLTLILAVPITSGLAAYVYGTHRYNEE